jgi:hypothetical protein
MRGRTGTAQLPLHGGRAPVWLFSRMVRLAREITIHIVSFPYPVDTGTYDKTVEVLRAAVTKAGIDRSERVAALKRLVRFGEERIRRRKEAEG